MIANAALIVLRTGIRILIGLKLAQVNFIRNIVATDIIWMARTAFTFSVGHAKYGIPTAPRIKLTDDHSRQAEVRHGRKGFFVVHHHTIDG